MSGSSYRSGFLIEALKGAHAGACNALSNEEEEVENKH